MKGQMVTDWLMTYGWAILIVIVVVSALYSMGVFNAYGRYKNLEYECMIFCYRQQNMSFNYYTHKKDFPVCSCKDLICDESIKYKNITFSPKCEMVLKDFEMID